jgi:hypothetical protein
MLKYADRSYFLVLRLKRWTNITSKRCRLDVSGFRRAETCTVFLRLFDKDRAGGNRTSVADVGCAKIARNIHRFVVVFSNKF